MLKLLTLCNGFRIRWEAVDSNTEERLDETARICGWETTTDRTEPAHVRAILHGESAPEELSAQRPWATRLGDVLQIVRPDDREIHFYLPPTQYKPQQLLFLRRLLSFLPLAGAIAQGDAALVHGTLVTRRSDGCGILLSGDSGAGKSTSYRRLPEEEWEKHCDDASLLVRCGTNYFAHPLPTWTRWSRGLSPIDYRGCTPVPVHQFYLLDQAQEDRREEISPQQQMLGASRNLLYLLYIPLSSIPKEEAIRLKVSTFDFAGELRRNIPVCKLNTTLHGKFWNCFPS